MKRTGIVMNAELIEEDLSGELARLAQETERITGIHRLEHRELVELSRYLGDIRSLLDELERHRGEAPIARSVTEHLVERFRSLEGKVKEMRNDISRGSLQH